MDDERIASLARTLAAFQDRRGLVRSALMGLLLFLPTARLARAQEDCGGACYDGQLCQHGICVTPCANDRDCRSKKDDPCVLNTCNNGVCIQAMAECLPGYECCRGECCPKPCATDAECAVLDPCRLGRCDVNGFCAYTSIDPCTLCQSDSECLHVGDGLICCGGACQRPCPDGTVIGKGCECTANGSATINGLVVRDDASG